MMLGLDHFHFRQPSLLIPDLYEEPIKEQNRLYMSHYIYEAILPGTLFLLPGWLSRAPAVLAFSGSSTALAALA